MESKTAIMIGAAAALAAGSALAAPLAAEAPAVPVAATYADLLEPIPNAVERLKIADAQADALPRGFIQAQAVDHHHHHHHHHHSRQWYLAHGYVWAGGAWVIRPVPHHHHHHHHHHDE